MRAPRRRADARTPPERPGAGRGAQRGGEGAGWVRGRGRSAWRGGRGCAGAGAGWDGWGQGGWREGFGRRAALREGGSRGRAGTRVRRLLTGNERGAGRRGAKRRPRKPTPEEFRGPRENGARRGRGRGPTSGSVEEPPRAGKPRASEAPFRREPAYDAFPPRARVRSAFPPRARVLAGPFRAYERPALAETLYSWGRLVLE